MTDAKKPTKGATFSDDEKAAMRERAKEQKAAARRGQDRAAGESDLLAKIAEMPAPDRAMAERLHAIVTASAPDLEPKTWYGMPAYARDGKVVCFFKAASKFNSRYATFGFEEQAQFDHGTMWPTSYALKDLTAADEARIGALVKKGRQAEDLKSQGALSGQLCASLISTDPSLDDSPATITSRPALAKASTWPSTGSGVTCVQTEPSLDNQSASARGSPLPWAMNPSSDAVAIGPPRPPVRPCHGTPTASTTPSTDAQPIGCELSSFGSNRRPPIANAEPVAARALAPSPLARPPTPTLTQCRPSSDTRASNGCGIPPSGASWANGAMLVNWRPSLTRPSSPPGGPSISIHVRPSDENNTCCVALSGSSHSRPRASHPASPWTRSSVAPAPKSSPVVPSTWVHTSPSLVTQIDVGDRPRGRHVR